MKMTVAKKLIKAIDKRGLSKSKIARALKISRPTLYTRLKDNKFTEYQIGVIEDKFL